MTQAPQDTRRYIIAVDGPVAVGKSSVARGLAARLRYLHIDSGAMYRVVALAAMRSAVAVDDAEGLARLVERLSIELRSTAQGQKVFCDEEDVTEAIRAPEVSRDTSTVSAVPAVRTRLVELQREMGKQGGVVMEGRDIGTVVFPGADFKFFLVADPQRRAERRYLEQQEKGIEQELEAVREDLERRDVQDSTRAVSPLQQAADAIEVDTSDLSLEEVIERIAGIVAEGPLR